MRYSDDEFNFIKITNEDENPNFEYGLTQEEESSSYVDNNDRLRDEVNDNPTSNTSNKPKKEEKRRREDKSSKKDDSSGGSSSSSSSVSTTIATVAGASMVVVPTLSVIVGINLFFSGRCQMNTIDTTETTIAYKLDLTDINEDECIIKLENKDFSDSKALSEGSNSGEFVNLTSNTEYKISVIDVTYDNYVLYEDKVFTKQATPEPGPEPGPEPEPQDEGSVKVTNLVPWANKVGVRLYLTGNGKDSYDISIRSDGTQLQQYDLVEGKNEFYFTQLNAQTSYEVIVRNIGTSTNIYDEFITTIAEDEAFVTLDLVPDLSDGTFEVLLAYDYRNQSFSAFELVMSDSQENIKQFRLENTDSYQTVTLNNPDDPIQFDFNDPNGFTYYATYLYEQEERTTEQQKVVFDTSTAPVKYNITLNPGDSADDPIVIPLREGKSYRLPENPFTPPEGYRFKVWKKGYAEYQPGMKVISYLDKDYEFVATYVEETKINSFEFSNEIDFTTSEHQIPFTIDYVDPEYDLVRLRITFYNPDAEKAAQGKNIVAEFSPYDGSFYASDISDMTLNTNTPIDYKIEYLLESVGEYTEYTTGTVTFVDKEGREASVSSFEFDGITVYESTNERILKWHMDYTDTFYGGFFRKAGLWLTPIDGGEAININPGMSLPESGEVKSISSLDLSNIDFENGVYTYSLVLYDQYDYENVIYEGIIDMAEETSHINNFEVYYEYYTAGGKIYIAVSGNIADKTNQYGDLTFYLASNNDSISFPLEKRSGFQYFDITGFDPTVLEDNNAYFYVYSSGLGAKIINDTETGYMQGCGSVITEYVGGFINTDTVYKDNIEFNIGLFRYTGSSGTLSNAKLKIFDPNNSSATYYIPFNISDFAKNGINEGVVSVSEDYEQRDELLALLKSKKVTVSLTYDCYDPMMGDTDTYTRKIIDNYYFSIR